MRGGYSTGFVAYVLANWADLAEAGRLPKRSWELGIRAKRRLQGGASYEYPAAVKVDIETALARLDGETRRIVHLRFLSGLPRWRVAQRLGVRTCRAMDPLVEAAIGTVTEILNGGDGMASNGYADGKTLEEQRGHELETLYDRLDHKLKDLPPGWRQVVVKREPGTKMFAVAVTY